MKFIDQTKGQCSALALVGHQVCTKAALSLSTLAGLEGEIIMKGLGVEIKTGMGHSPITITSRLNQRRMMRNKPQLLNPTLPYSLAQLQSQFSNTSFSTPEMDRNESCGQFVLSLLLLLSLPPTRVFQNQSWTMHFC